MKKRNFVRNAMFVVVGCLCAVPLQGMSENFYNKQMELAIQLSLQTCQKNIIDQSFWAAQNYKKKPVRSLKQEMTNMMDNYDEQLKNAKNEGNHEIIGCPESVKTFITLSCEKENNTWDVWEMSEKCVLIRKKYKDLHFALECFGYLCETKGGMFALHALMKNLTNASGSYNKGALKCPELVLHVYSMFMKLNEKK